MARPKKWGSEAERKRAERQSGRNPDAERAPTLPESIQSGRNPDAPPDNVTPIRTRAQIEEHAHPASASAGTVTAPSLVPFVDCPRVPHDPAAPPWRGAGRGTVTEWQGAHYVLIARDGGEHGVVTAADWWARLPQRCEHNLAGWACHAC